MTEPPAPPPSGPPEGEFSEFFHTDDLPDSTERARSHRAPPVETPEFLARLLAPATAIVVVIVVIVLLVWINGGSSGDQQSPAAVGGSGPTAPVATNTSSTASATPKPTATHRKASHPEVTPTPSHSARQSASRAVMAPVTVLNNSTRTGLAATAASQLRRKGWRVAAVGNLQGRTPLTTVYYAAGEREAAKHLAHDFTSIQRVLPNRAGGISGTDLTLVLTRTWQV